MRQTVSAVIAVGIVVMIACGGIWMAGRSRQQMGSPRTAAETLPPSTTAGAGPSVAAADPKLLESLNVLRTLAYITMKTPPQEWNVLRYQEELANARRAAGEAGLGHPGKDLVEDLITRWSNAVAGLARREETHDSSGQSEAFADAVREMQDVAQATMASSL